MSSNQPYQDIYGIRLFDDLHNYLPDILYNSERFHSVHDLLDYILIGVNNASPYTRGIREYRLRRNLIQQQQQQPQPQRVAPAPSLNIPQRVYNRTTTRNYNEPEQSSVQFQATTIPLSSFTIPLSGMESITSSLLNQIFHPTALSSFLEQTVVVRPTEQQINSATQIENILNPTENESCAICQEDFQSNDITRKIIHCGHGFHRDCIDTWFSASVHCPTCRYDIRDYTSGSSSSSTSSNLSQTPRQAPTRQTSFPRPPQRTNTYESNH